VIEDDDTEGRRSWDGLRESRRRRDDAGERDEAEKE
jgi:hypothetical protein